MRYETKCAVCGQRKPTYVRRLKRQPYWHIPDPHECAQAECCAECWRRIYERTRETNLFHSAADQAP